MALNLVTGPATEPLTIAEVKAHLRLATSAAEPAPGVITVALSAVAGLVTAGAHRYLATFVTADGETEAGAISASVTTILATAGKVNLSGIPIGGAAVTARKIYRTAAGGSTYLLLTTIADNVTTAYTDNIADASLGAAAPSTNTTADPELVAWLTAARQHAEAYTHRALITQTWQLKFDNGFPAGQIVLPKPPLISTTTATGLVITYTDTAGAAQTWTEGLYSVDAPAGPHAGPGRIEPVYGGVYPSTQAIPNAVTVQFVAGYGAAAAVPKGIAAGIKLLIAHWYENRQAAAGGTGAGLVLRELPYGVEALWWPFKAF